MSKIKEIELLLIEGFTLPEIAKKLGISRQRVHQIKKKLFPTMARSEFGITKRARLKKHQKQAELFEKYGRASYRYQTDLEAAQHGAYIRKRENSKKGKNWSWSISFQDIKWETHCPITGQELDYFAERRQENSPSFDRVDPTRGYEPGNVRIISWRANRIKNDGTAEEHLAIADYIRGLR